MHATSTLDTEVGLTEARDYRGTDYRGTDYRGTDYRGTDYRTSWLNNSGSDAFEAQQDRAKSSPTT